MKTIAIHPNFERLNKYFIFWVPEEIYPIRMKLILGESKSVVPSYRSYVKKVKKELTEKVQNVIVDFDQSIFCKLLERHNLIEFQDDILFVTTIFHHNIPIAKSLASDSLRNEARKHYEILKFLKILSEKNQTELELEIKVKDKNKIDSIIIDNPNSVNKIIEAIYDATFYGYANRKEYIPTDLENRPFPKLRDLTLEFLESQLQSLRSKKGRKKGISGYSAQFMSALLKYLNHETQLKSEPGTKCSNFQAKFLFDLMTILGLVDYDKLTILYPEDYIRAILSYREKSMNALRNEYINASRSTK